jgi:hypothetical protein
MNEKVKLPKKVAENIEFIKNFAKWTDREIIAAKAKEDKPFNGAYEGLNECDFDTLISALINGYEVEKTPEDKVHEFFEAFTNDTDDTFDAGVAYGISRTLNMLGIQIEGVNA